MVKTTFNHIGEWNSSYTIPGLWRKSLLIFIFVLSEIFYVYLRIYMYVYT